MKTRRFFFVMVGLFVLLILLIIGVAAEGNAILQQKSKKLTVLKIQNKAVEQQETSLKQAKKDLEKYKDLEKISKTVVPQDKDQAKTIREITKIAGESGINLKAFTFQSSGLGQAPVATPKSSDGTGDSKTTAAPPITQVKPVEGIPGVYSLDITITPVEKQPIPYNKFLEFLEHLENNRRTAHVDKISVTPTENGVTFSLTVKAYVKP